jgi:hypothetical protein
MAMGEFLTELTARTSAGMAQGRPATELLRDLSQTFERTLPASVVGVTILDPSGRSFEHAVFPSLDDDYAIALEGILVTDRPGSCARAVFDGKTIDCTDVAFDGRFSAGWKQLSLKHGLRALISVPAKAPGGASLGTLVVTYPPGKPLNRDQRDEAEAVASLAAQVLRYRQSSVADAGQPRD